jgi:NAD(P)-dependent dehydrogenase (short-subunit alcohol dehydrogenase family)
MEEFEGRVAVVTGGASGIGLGMARAFAGEGMKIVLADIEADPLSEAVTLLEDAGASVSGVVCDVSQQAAVDQLRDEALSKFGAVHVVCNNAGVGGSVAPVPIWERTAEEWEWVMGVNLMGVIHGMRSFVPVMIEQGEGGHVVNTASIAGLIPGGGIYGVTKHAVVSLTESLFQGLSVTGQTVGASVLCPGWVNTRILESERNRAEAPRDVPTELNPDMQVIFKAIEGFVANGLDPLDVGRLVVDAIRSHRFYVLTHPHWKHMIERRTANILEDQDPIGEPPPAS